MNDQSLRKAAVFVMALGPEVGGKVMTHLPEPVVEQVAHAIASLGKISFQEKKEVVAEFVAVSGSIAGMATGGEDAAKRILESGFGTRRASSLLSRVVSYREIKSFEHLKNVDPLTIATYLKNEHPQTVAVVLAHMDPRDSGPVLARLPAAVQGDVAHRMAVLEAPDGETMKAVEAVLARQLQGRISAREARFGGKKQVAEILNEIDREAWQKILDEMREIDDDVANEVNNLMFLFEDIVMLADANIREILKEIDSKELTMALKGATAEIKEKVFSNMSKRAAEGVREDMEYMGPVRLAEVEEAQQRIVEVIRTLEEAGTITLGGGGRDAALVS